MAATEDYGLIVGIDDYKNPPYNPLDGAKRDAEDFIRWLTSPAGGDLDWIKNVKPFTKLSDASGSEPMISHLWALLMKIRELAPQGKKRIGRRLYIFLAGHGVSPMELDEAGLVPLDATGALTPYLPGKQSADDFCLSARFEEVLLFMDCCRVTDLLLKRFTIPITEKPDPAATGKVKRFYAFATALGKAARETEHKGVVRGIFSRVLLEGLEGKAPTDREGRLTTTQLRTYLEAELKKIKINGEEQVPKFPSSDEIVLREGAGPTRVAVNLKLSAPTDKIAVLDGGNNLAPIVPENDDATPEGRRFLLPAARGYVIQALDATGNPTRMITVKIDVEEIYATL